MRLPRRQFLQLAAGAGALPAVSRIARSQVYPSRPVRLVVGFPAGGTNESNSVARSSSRTGREPPATSGSNRSFRSDGAGWLEPISKSSEEENKAGELNESKEVLGVVFPADENAALPLDPRKEAFDEPAAHVAN